MGGEVKIPLPTHAQVQEILDIVERLPQTLVEGELSDDWVTLFEPTTETELVEVLVTNLHGDAPAEARIRIDQGFIGAAWNGDDDDPTLEQTGEYNFVFAELDEDEVFVQPTRMVLEPGQSILGRASVDGVIYARVLGMEVI